VASPADGPNRPPIPKSFGDFIVTTLVLASGGWGGGGGIAARIKKFRDTSPAFEGRRPPPTQGSTTPRPAPRAGTQVPPKAPFPPPGYNPVLTPPVPYEPPPPPPTGPRPGTPVLNPTGPDFSGTIPWGVFGTFDIFQILKEAAAWRMRYSGPPGGVVFPKQPKIPDKPPETFENREMGNPWPPKPPKPYQLPPELRETIYVTPIRMPVSKRLEGYTVAELERMVKAPAPAPAPAPATVPKWMSLVKFGLPLLLPLLTSGGKQQSQRQVVNVPDPFGPGNQPDPRLEPAPSVFFGDIGGREGGGVGSFTCECLPPKKKRRKKKRTVCYTGTYTERADGTRKLKKRKVPCK